MSSTFRTLFISLILLFTLNPIFSQDRKNYELLWEIKHKTGNKKSYLFGTLHLKDARAFKFSDSVIPAIKKSEMFALEIHPDSAVSGFSESYFNTKRENVYKKILSKEEYQKLKNRFYEINKIDLDSFPMKHPSIIESMLTFQKEKVDDRRTFLDAYLYGIAFNNKKIITGLEKVEDQIPLLENISEMKLRESILSILDNAGDKKNNEFDKITELYYEGDLEKIWNYISDSQANDSIMTKRNNVMFNSLDEIMKTHSIFAAVGAAHLPGENGLITLLRENGYQVNKVDATFNDYEQQYEIAPDLDRWVMDRNDFLGYSVLTPSKAVPVEITETINAMTSTDLIYGGTFVYMVADLRNQILKEGYDFVENIINTQTQKDTDSIISRNTFVKDGVDFTEVLIKKAEIYTRLQVVFKDKIIYTFMTENTLEEITSVYANAFFDSVELFAPKIEASVWQNHTDRMGAYSVEVPGKIHDRSQTSDNPNGDKDSPYIINIFSAEDKANKAVYLLRYNDQPVGYYLDEKESYFDYFDNYFKENGTFLKEPQDIMIDGNEGKKYELLFSDKFHTVAKLILRGNRTYLLMAQKYNEDDKISEDDLFFNSFKFLPYAEASFDTIINIQDKYSFKAPSKTVIVKEEIQDEYSEYSYVKNYSSLDPTTSGTYLVQHIKLKPYYRKKSLQQFYDDYAELLTEYDDTIVSNVNITMGGKPARAIRMNNQNTHVKQRMKLLLDDDSILLFLTYLGDEEIDKPRVDRFFNSLGIKKSSNNFDLTASKADLIFKNLKSKDSIKFAEGKGALNYYEFDASEYKLLEKNLKREFKDDSIYYGTKYYIIGALTDLEKPETLKTFTDFYKNKKSSHHARMEILEQMLRLKNKNAETTYFDLLENHKLERKDVNGYDIMTTLSDTLSLFVNHDAQLAKLTDINDYRDGIASIYAYNISNDSVYGNKMPLLKNKLLSYMYQDVTTYLDTIARKNNHHINEGLMYSYIEFSKEFENKPEEVVKTLKLMSEQFKDSKWLQAQALMAATKLNVEIEPQTLNEAFEDMYVRFELMESLVKTDNSKSIPKVYLEPQEFAKLSLYNNVGDDYDGYPNIFDYLGEVTVGEKNYFVFTFSYGEISEEDTEEADGTEKYVGIVEKTPINFSEFEMAKSFTDWETVEEDWKAQATKTINDKVKSENSETE